MRRGWLGFEHAGNGYWYNVHVNLPSSLGVVLFVLCVAGLAWSLYRRRRVDLVLAAYVVVYYLYVSGWAALNDRYLLPIVPVLVLLAARFAVGLARLRFVRRRLLAPAVAGLLIVAFMLPLSASIAYDRALTGPDVRSIAKAWIETHVKPGSTVAVRTVQPTPRVALERSRSSPPPVTAPPTTGWCACRCRSPAARTGGTASPSCATATSST